MVKDIIGIHHITSIAGDPQENFDFYNKILALRLVKKTVNFDSPNIYHLYFGDRQGSPGTVITFFPTPRGEKGRIGGGQVAITSYAVPENSLDFWKKHLNSKNVTYKENKRFGERLLSFCDNDGLQLELVEKAEGEMSNWNENIDKGKAIKGFAGAVLNSFAPDETKSLFVDLFGYKIVDENEEYVRLKAKADIANTIDINKQVESKGTTGIGVVHHIAFRVKDAQEQLRWKEKLEDKGYKVTGVKDRNYFTSIYFREKGGILFEIATDGPGFVIDEDIDKLGEALKLPSQYEKRREEIEEELIPIVY